MTPDWAPGFKTVSRVGGSDPAAGLGSCRNGKRRKRL